MYHLRLPDDPWFEDLRRHQMRQEIMSLMVGGCRIPVVQVPGLDCIGQWCPAPAGEIQVCPELAEGTLALTVIHEVLHALSDVYDIGLTEKDVLCLEQGIASFIQMNPEVALRLYKTLLAQAATS